MISYRLRLIIFSVMSANSLFQGIVLGASAQPSLMDHKLNLQVLAKNLSNASEFVIVDNNILLSHSNDDKVMLLRDNILRKYPVLNVNPGNAIGEGISGLIAVPYGLKFIVLVGYVTPEENLNPYSNKILYSYYWNDTGLELVNPKRIIEIPIDNITRFDTGTLVGENNFIFFTMANSTVGATRETTNPDSGGCKTILLRVPIRNNSIDYPNKNNSSICFDAPIHGLTYDRVGNEVFGIQSYPNGKQGIMILNLLTNRINVYDICLLSDNLENTKFRNCLNLQRNSAPLTSLAFVNSTSLGPEYVNQLLLANANGSLFDINLTNIRSLDNTSSITADLFANGLGNISQIRLNPDGLYVLAIQGGHSNLKNGSESQLYLVSKEIKNFSDLNLTRNLDYTSIAVTLSLVFAIVIFAIFSGRYRRRKDEILDNR